MYKQPKKTQQYEQFYLKKLHTETFSSPSLKDEFQKLTDKLEHEIQAVKRRLRVKNLKMFRAKQKLKTIESEQQEMRQTLRHNIQDKLKASQTKLENLMVTKNSRSNSKEKLRQTTLSRIKSMQKTSKDESFRKSQQLSKDSQTFLLQRKMSDSRSRITSFGQTQSRTRYIQESSQQQFSQQNSVGVVKQQKKVLPAMLIVSDKEIRRRQTRKSKLEEEKDIKNLHQYIQKLNHIEVKRQNRQDRLAETVKLIQKQRKVQQERYASRKKAESFGEERSNKNYTSATREAIKNKYSFSELYAKKLEEKLAKKAYFEGESLREGDIIMRKQGEVRLKKRQNRLLSDAVREVQRKTNFQYMERFRS